MHQSTHINRRIILNQMEKCTMSSLTILLQLIFLAISLVIFNTNGYSIKMIPIESPDLKILPSHFTSQERGQFLANISMSRVLNLRKDLPLDSMTTILYTTKSRFVTQIGIGEGGGFNAAFLVLDTGSDLTWIQCEGCKTCFDLSQGKNFSYTQSPSFHRVSVNDRVCLPSSITYDGSCGFEIKYDLQEPHPTIRGLIARDSFQLTGPNKGPSDVYPAVVFGCTLEAENFEVFGTQNSIAGIFGMSTGPRSFLSQLDYYTKGRFSYCLAPFTNPPLATSTLSYGDDAQISGDDTRQVQTIPMHAAEAFHLYMIGISVDGKRLPIEPSLFELDEHGYTKGFFIDSGSPITVLTKSAYTPLRLAVVTYFRTHYNWRPGSPRSGMDLCYGPYPGYKTNPFPTVIFHFRDRSYAGVIDMVLGKDNMFEILDGDQGFCMAVNPVNDPGPCLFGAYQQVNFKILFDVRNSLLSFVPQNCREN